MFITSLTENYVFFLDSSNGINRRTAYTNSKSGKQRLTYEQPAHIVAQIMEVWGETLTVDDYTPEQAPPYDPAPSIPEQISGLQNSLLAAQQTITSLDLALIAAEQANTDNDLRLFALEAAV